MKIKNVLLVVVSFAAIAFFSLWINEGKARYDDMDKLCQYYASGAAGTLQEFVWGKEELNEERMDTYWYGVSRFYAFMDTLQFMPDSGGWNSAQYKNCSAIYDHMLHKPDEVLAHMDELIAALEFLDEDYDSPDSRRALSELSYNFQYIW